MNPWASKPTQSARYTVYTSYQRFDVLQNFPSEQNFRISKVLAQYHESQRYQIKQNIQERVKNLQYFRRRFPKQK